MIPFKETAGEAIPELGPLQRKLLLAGAAGMALSLVGLFINTTQFLQSYLLAYMWCLGVTLGCLAFGMIHQLSGGAWGVVIRRPIGAASRVIPVMTLLFLPIVLGMNAQHGPFEPSRQLDLVSRASAARPGTHCGCRGLARFQRRPIHDLTWPRLQSLQ